MMRVSGGKVEENIAMGVTRNECVLKLLEECNFLMGTSTSISGEESFTVPLKCQQSIGRHVLLLDGGKISLVASTIEILDGILDIHREGVLTKEENPRVL